MSKPTEDLDRLSEEVRWLSGEIAAMKAKVITMEPGPEKKLLRQLIKNKQYQALFYLDKIENLAKLSRKRNQVLPEP